MNRTIVGLVAGGVLVFGAIGYLEGRKAKAEAIEYANAVADTFSARLDTANSTIEERGRVIADRDAAIAELEDLNLDLADDLKKERATVLSASRTVARLRDSLRSARAPIVVLPDSSRLVAIDWGKTYDPENFFRVSGSVLLERGAEEATVALDLDLGFGLDVVVSRASDLSLRCDADLGIPGVALTSLDCIDSLDDPLASAPSLAFEMFQPPALLMGGIIGTIGLIVGFALGS